MAARARRALKGQDGLVEVTELEPVDDAFAVDTTDLGGAWAGDGVVGMHEKDESLATDGREFQLDSGGFGCGELGGRRLSEKDEVNLAANEAFADLGRSGVGNLRAKSRGVGVLINCLSGGCVNGVERGPEQSASEIRRLGRGGNESGERKKKPRRRRRG